MSGEYTGRDAVLQFLRQTVVLSDGTYRTELQYVVADDVRAVAVYRARGEREGRALDIEQALFCVLRDGQIVDVTAVPFDFEAFDSGKNGDGRGDDRVAQKQPCSRHAEQHHELRETAGVLPGERHQRERAALAVTGSAQYNLSLIQI